MRERNSLAFRQLSERYTLGLLRVARAVLNDEAEAEDVVQETLLRLWRTSDGIEVDDSGLGAWLRRVARNLAIDRLRKARRLSLTDSVPEEAEAARQDMEVEDADRKVLVDAAIAELPERQRLALLMFHHEEMTVAEIAAALKVSEHAAESLLARARRGLKERLSEVWSGLVGRDGHREQS